MPLTLALYGVAAAFDLRTRRVPNIVWLVGLGALLWRGVGVVSVVSALGVLGAGVLAWRRGGFGGADVKALALLPLALPSSWPLAILGTALATLVGFLGMNREELPFLVATFLGVVLAVMASTYF